MQFPFSSLPYFMFSASLAILIPVALRAWARGKNSRRIHRLQAGFKRSYIAWKDGGDPLAKLEVEAYAIALRKG
jgi:hypothetical protein